MQPVALPPRPHLFAALVALAVAGATLAAGVLFCNGLELRYVHALAADLSEAKLQGVVLQRHAFAQPDLLVLYGSSELAKEMPNNATEFFQDYPTGFRVFPVGQPGTASLAVLQKVAAVGEDVRGRKVAFSISPGWFFSEVFDPAYYEGNFSQLQAYELAFSSVLSPGLKRDIARRMIEFPKTLDDDWLLAFALERLAGDTAGDRALYAAVWPLGRLWGLIGRAQDHYEAAVHILSEDEKLDEEPKRGRRVLNWNEMVKRAAQFAKSAVPGKRVEVARRRAKRARDRIVNPTRTFVQTVEKAREWTDLELLLRVFAELGAKPLLLSMPVEDIRLEVYGVTADVRTAYLHRLSKLAARFDAPLLDFREHQKDPAFLVDFLDHLSPEGWLYYNQALNEFFHRKEPDEPPSAR